MKTKLATVVLLLTLASAAVLAQVNAGEQKPETTLPFNMSTGATFTLPWPVAFLSGWPQVVPRKVGPVWLGTPTGQQVQGHH